MRVEILLVRQDVLVRHAEVLRHFIIKGLSRNLHANAQSQLRVHDLLPETGEENLQVPLARLLDLIHLVVFFDHDLVEVDLIIKILVELQALERLQHFVHDFFEVFYQSLVVDFEVELRNLHVLLLDSRLLLVQDLREDLTVIIF